jgi:hypothetical protein
MADGYIAGFDTKYHCNYWRPATAIRAGGDSEWLSYLPTPPVPDYPSTHTVEGAAAATVMARFFNTDFISFSMTSGPPYPGITRNSGASRKQREKRCVPYSLRNSLLDCGERRLCPGRTHWGMGFRKRIATRKGSAGNHGRSRFGTAALKLRSIRTLASRPRAAGRLPIKHRVAAAWEDGTKRIHWPDIADSPKAFVVYNGKF